VTAASALSIVLALSALAGQEPLRFPSQVDNVYVDAFVTHKGKPVTGLTAENFEIRDNGMRQQVRLVSLDAVPVTVLLVFDTSASVAGEALGHLKAAGHAVLDGLRPGEQAALVTFNQEVVVRVPPDADLARVREELDRIRARAATALYDAAYVGFALPVRGTRSVIVLFSDGEDNSSWLEAEEVQAAAVRTDALLQVVGTTQSVDEVHRRLRGETPTGPEIRHVRSSRVDDLRRIAESTGGRFWQAERTEHLKDTFTRILGEMRTRYLLTYQPTGVERGGEHRLEVRLRGAKGKVRSRDGYFVPAARGTVE
jgi:VWFA-related protein